MSNRKKKNNEISKRVQLKWDIERNPDWCWCKETLDLDADVDYEKDFAIDETDPIDGYPHPESTNYSLPIFKCKRCGKKHTLPVAY